MIILSKWQIQKQQEKKQKKKTDDKAQQFTQQTS